MTANEVLESSRRCTEFQVWLRRCAMDGRKKLELKKTELAYCLAKELLRWVSSLDIEDGKE